MGPRAGHHRTRYEQPNPTFIHHERTLTHRGWAEQTGIKYHTLYGRITKSGMPFAVALEKGADGPDFDMPVTAFEETGPSLTNHFFRVI